MTTTPAETGPHTWAIAGIGATAAHRRGVALTLTDTWTAALGAGRAALLAGALATLAVVVDGELEALYDPGDDRGGLDPAAVTADLVEIHQDMTAHVIAGKLTAGG